MICTMYAFPRCGLYAITDSGLLAGRDLEAAVAGAIRGGAVAVQYRDKSEDGRRRAAEATTLRALCKRMGAAFIVNDDVDLAADCAADGVHLGRHDADYANARARLGDSAIIGVSCHADLEHARRAAAEGADYVAFGRFFPSATKPYAPPAALSVLERAQGLLSVPVVAIGGITPENGRGLLAAGADLLAVVHGVFAAADTQAAAARYAALFDTDQTKGTS